MKKLCKTLLLSVFAAGLIFTACDSNPDPEENKQEQQNPGTTAGDNSTSDTNSKPTDNKDDKDKKEESTKPEDKDKETSSSDKDTTKPEDKTDSSSDKDTSKTDDNNNSEDKNETPEDDNTSNPPEETPSPDSEEEPTDTPANITDYDTIISGSEISWAVWNEGISAYDNKKVKITFSGKIAIENEDSASYSKNILVQINDSNKEYPTIASATVSKNWTEITGSKTLTLGTDSQIYISTYNIKDDLSKLTIYLKDLTYKVTEISTSGSKNWLGNDVPSLYETYKDQFDYIGLAAEYGNFGLRCSGNKHTGTYSWDGSDWGTPNELYYEEIQNGIAKHANSITLGNELKPQFVLQWWNGDGSSQTMVDFTASNGETIKVPSKLNGEGLIYATLNAAKAAGVQMRGHVLTWHSQTPDGFFAENYSPSYDGNLISNMVSKEVMTARHEWYIKTVLKCVADWEAANGYGTGNHIIWAWDVVNEATADDAGKTYTGDNQNWLRGSTSETKDQKPDAYPQGSRWYQLYGNEEFIVNAFRFANAYAPSDVKLCYNDYNEYMDYSEGWKTSAILKLVERVRNGESQNINGTQVSPRLDVIAMQSHVGIEYPGSSTYENALKRFLDVADVHISELDFSAATQAEAATAYGEYFEMFQKYGKNSSSTHKITNVTIWGINNENSWINPASGKNKKTYPLLFTIDDKVTTTMKTVEYDTGAEQQPRYDVGDSYLTNDSFWAVINAHN